MLVEQRIHFLGGVLALELFEEWAAEARELYGPLLTDGRPDLRLRVERAPGPLTTLDKANPVVSRLPDGGELRTGWYRLEQSGTEALARVRTLNRLGLDHLLYQWTAMLLLPPRGLLFHAAGLVSPRGHGYLALGRSEAGKTTLARNALEGDWEVLSDEAPALRRDPAGWRVLATPFSGELGLVAPATTAAPLDKLLFLAKGETCELTPLSPGEALRGLLRTVISYGGDETFSRMTLKLLEELVTTRPACRLVTPRQVAADELTALLEG